MHTSSQATSTPMSKRTFAKGTGIALICLAIGALVSREFFPAGQPVPPLKETGDVVVTPAEAPEPSPTALRPATLVASNLENVDTSLIKRLLPQAQIRGVEKLDLGMNTWMWEVDMLAVEGSPQTAGFVYLSADGSKLLNGPLMDKRSKIGLTPPPPRSEVPSAPISSAPPAGAGAGQSMAGELSPQAKNDLESRIATLKLQREAFLGGVEQLPYIASTQGTYPVYVMFDPLCSICHKVYKQQDSLAAAYDIELRWIPVFNDEKSYPLAALLRKTYDLDRSRGLSMFDAMMTSKWKSDEHHEEFAGLTEGDYGLLGPAAAVYMEVNKIIPGKGTPFVFFRNPSGEVEIIAGLPLATDWLSFSKPRKS